MINSDLKKTEYEDFLNDIHIDDYITSPSNELIYLQYGLEFGKRIYKYLNKFYPSSFRIIISYNETTYVENEVEIYGGCVVKFYMIRHSCDNLFRIDDLEEIKAQAVLVME